MLHAVIMEKLRIETMSSTLKGRENFSEVANLPLPPPPAWGPWPTGNVPMVSFPKL